MAALKLSISGKSPVVDTIVTLHKIFLNQNHQQYMNDYRMKIYFHKINHSKHEIWATYQMGDDVLAVQSGKPLACYQESIFAFCYKGKVKKKKEAR